MVLFIVAHAGTFLGYAARARRKCHIKKVRMIHIRRTSLMKKKVFVKVMLNAFQCYDVSWLGLHIV